MRRCLFLLISVLLLLGFAVDHALPEVAEVALQGQGDRCRCCAESDPEEGDCCDTDFGACCAASVPAAVHTAFAVAHPQLAPAQAEVRSVLPLHLLLPRDNGPPPTPPPIA